jgi:Lsr2 protein
MYSMQVTIDSTEPLDKVLPVINALYGVSLTVPVDADVVRQEPSRSRRARAPRPQQRAGRRNKRGEVTASAVREWARSNGHQVSDRGRVAAELIEAYRAAN